MKGGEESAHSSRHAAVNGRRHAVTPSRWPYSLRAAHTIAADQWRKDNGADRLVGLPRLISPRFQGAERGGQAQGCLSRP